jgi:methylmalonyl-CoA mutase C-terminal domain/subunit
MNRPLMPSSPPSATPESPGTPAPVQAGPAPGARKLRILVGKAGLDGHDRGAKVVARALADAGYEVIYTGLHQTPEMIAATAVQESVDAVGLSIMSGAHMTLFPAVLAALRARGAGDVMVFGGGIVPKDDAAALAAQGVGAIFTPGASTREIVDWIERELRPRVEQNAAHFDAGEDPAGKGTP